ncbi:MAG: carbohydrate ABC transporter permease [Clostridia bacterium]|nr:carbohydrate ABC transporter permease [Clostridia bacterium]
MEKSSRTTQVFLNILFVVLCILFLIPFIMLISASFTDEKEIIMNGYNLWPRKFSLEAYKYVLRDPTAVVNAYKTTIIFSVVSMVLATLLMSMVAYPLTKRDLKGRTGLSFYLYFVTLFSGGMVPSYILITQYLHLQDTIWVYILPGLISPWYVFMLRTFFQGLPDSITEAALIDGASEYRIFFTIILPLSKPVLATIALFTFLGRWNLWWESMLYINKRDDLVSLQYLLQKIMRQITFLRENSTVTLTEDMAATLPSESVRMATAMLVAGPALVVFPFFQKYFTRGLTVGSVKG